MHVKVNKYQQEADLLLNISEEAESELIQKHEHSCDSGIAVNSAFTPFAKKLTGAKKAKEMLY